MIEELELKHLAPYLPYDIKIMDIYTGKIGSIKDILDIDGYNTIKIKQSYEDAEHIWMFKPILRPLSDLFNGNYEFILDEFSEHSLESFKIAFLSELKPINAFDKVNYTIMQLLFENHFDIFGLIESNLAIDKNTLKQ